MCTDLFYTVFCNDLVLPFPSQCPNVPPSSLSVRCMKKVEGPTHCMVMACVSGQAVRTSARTLDSFWSKSTPYDIDFTLEIVCKGSLHLSCFKTHKSYPFMWKHLHFMGTEGPHKESIIAFERAHSDLPDSQLTGFSLSSAVFEPTLIHNQSSSWCGRAW